MGLMQAPRPAASASALPGSMKPRLQRRRAGHCSSSRVGSSSSIAGVDEAPPATKPSWPLQQQPRRQQQQHCRGR
ncbi:hypothetical protein PR002_g33190 [Phytophthora rubi]|uniref:Uncharacterized protein n=1 Tax=Phytophthora rubi TaxID=129364 RepID=A0A6A3FX11_9STRA|nr:hypothetical protein PR002_g33190 [Phytophthora rubi]